MHRRIVPDIVRDQTVVTVAPNDSVREVAELMARQRIGAVVVASAEAPLAGIFTERDVLTRVVARGLDPSATPVGTVMTANPDTVAPDSLAIEALTMMSQRGYRHLPVMAGGTVVGMVSIRDLYAAVKHELEEDIQEREAFMFGSGYGAQAS
ncbi:MAG: CBS domain-containing protein [Thalassobaculales bacterium]